VLLQKRKVITKKIKSRQLRLKKEFNSYDISLLPVLMCHSQSSFAGFDGLVPSYLAYSASLNEISSGSSSFLFGV
jgi:hypothetical protein